MPRCVKIVGRHGNKDTDIKFFKIFLPKPEDVKTVVEPFAGSFAVSSRVCSDMEKIHINDTDPAMYWIYNNYQKYIDTIKDTYLNCQYKEHVIDFYDKITDIPDYVKNEIISRIIIRGSMFKKRITHEILPTDITVLKKATITNNDYIDILEQYKNDESAFVFLDPPYIFSNNTSYCEQYKDGDNTDMIMVILEHLKTSKCKIMLIINKMKLLEIIYKDFIKGEYTKIYQLGKRVDKHLIITNY